MIILDSAAPPDPHWGADQKWLLASHLQKAIRRGLPDAAGWAAQGLAHIDATYLRYRLSVIAVEEVAGANPGLVAATAAGGWTKKTIDAQGGVDFLVSAARTWAASLKDRTPCTWMACARWAPEFEAEHGPWGTLPLASAQAMAWDPELPWWARGLAAWRAIGTDRFPTTLLPKVEGDWPAWCEEAARQGATPDQQAALAFGAKQREAHPVFLALAWSAQTAEGGTPSAPPVTDLGVVGPWLSAALDKHTREGLSALRLRTGTPEARAWARSLGLSPDDLTDAVGRLWFWMEGGQVDRALTYPTARRIDQEVKQRFLADRHLDGRALFERFGQPLLMQQARLKVMGLSAAPEIRRPGGP